MKTEFLYFPTKNILVCLLAISQVPIEHGTVLPEKFNVMRAQIIMTTSTMVLTCKMIR